MQLKGMYLLVIGRETICIGGFTFIFCIIQERLWHSECGPYQSEEHQWKGMIPYLHLSVTVNLVVSRGHLVEIPPLSQKGS